MVSIIFFPALRSRHDGVLNAHQRAVTGASRLLTDAGRV
jgi:hypothetical protein